MIHSFARWPIRLEPSSHRQRRAAPVEHSGCALECHGTRGRLALAIARAITLADGLCWDSLSRGYTASFADQAKISAELRQLDIGVRPQ
jgi:hypothetical protein